MVEIAFPVIETDKDWANIDRRLDQYIATNLKKGRSEINLKKCSPAELSLLKSAKGLEVKELLKENVVKTITEQENAKLSKSDVMKMRFILTWKTDPESPLGKKGKARLVVLGFQDPFLGKEQTLAPTMTRRS